MVNVSWRDKRAEAYQKKGFRSLRQAGTEYLTGKHIAKYTITILESQAKIDLRECQVAGVNIQDRSSLPDE
jgi:hypothetical protein